MATKEDVLEQVVEEYLIHEEYFVRHNIKFLPSKEHPEFSPEKDSNHSDIDVLGFNPKKQGAERIYAVSCKSWQDGFPAEDWLKNLSEGGLKKVGNKLAWKHFRELVVPKWSDAFRRCIERETGETKFTYVLAVTHVRQNRMLWEQNPLFSSSLGENPIKILTFSEMAKTIIAGTGTTLASSEIGRLIQLFKAAGFKFNA